MTEILFRDLMPHPADCQIPPVGCDNRHWSRWWMTSKIFTVIGFVHTCSYMYLLTQRWKKISVSLFMGQWVLNCFGHQQVIIDHERWRCTVDDNFIGGGWIKIPWAGQSSRIQHDYWIAALQCSLEHSTWIKNYLDESRLIFLWLYKWFLVILHH